MFSPRSCHLARLEWEEVILQPCRSRRTTSPHRILTRTCPIQWYHESWKVSVLCHVCMFYTLQVLWRGKKQLHTFVFTFLHCKLGWNWTGKVTSERQFVFPTHNMFFQPRHGTVILFWSTWLQHYTMPIRGNERQLGSTLYFQKQKLSQYATRQANLSRVNRAFNEYMRIKNYTRRQKKGKMSLLEGVLCITYRDNDIHVWDEAWSPKELLKLKVM